MSDEIAEPSPIDLHAWIDEVSVDPVRRNQRQITAIILNATALVNSFRGNLVLKGGMLLAIAHGSRRQTSDIDFSARGDPEAFAEKFVEEMNRGLDRARARLGYVQWRCRVQGKIKLRPKSFAFATGPAVEARIGYARVGSPDEKHLLNDQCTNVIDIEISFREPIIETEELHLLAGNTEIEVYSVNELIAEKFRAFFQQKARNRQRRQDIYDIAFLIDRYGKEEIDRTLLLHALREKCAARGVPLDPSRIDDLDLIARARSQWHTMEVEIGELPSFEDCHAAARALFLSLPWDT